LIFTPEAIHKQVNINRWIRKIHIYLGLLNFSTLMILGLVGLAATLESCGTLDNKDEPEAVIPGFVAPAAASDSEVAHRIAETVKPPHAGQPVTHRNKANQLVIDFYSVNGHVQVTLLEAEHKLLIQTSQNSIWGYLVGLHATTIADETTDNAVRVWEWYMELLIWSLTFMALSGVWLGISTRWHWRWTRISLAAGCAAFAALYLLER
jgi:hypothetical protein